MPAAWHCGGVAPIRADAARQGCATFRIALLTPLLGAAPEGVAYLARNRWFESISLQQGVCETTVPQRQPPVVILLRRCRNAGRMLGCRPAATASSAVASIRSDCRGGRPATGRSIFSEHRPDEGPRILGRSEDPRLV